MDNNPQGSNRRKWVATAIAVVTIVVLLFIFIFSQFHLPERDPVETPEWTENADIVTTPAQDFAETNDITSASPEELSNMLGNLELQYENAKVNNESYATQQSGFRLAYAYWKAGQTENALILLKSLSMDFSYDQNFVEKCNDLAATIKGETK